MKPISFPWRLPDEVLALLTKLKDDDAIAFTMAINAALEEAAQIFEKDDSQRWGYTADLPVISAAIRALKSG